MSETFLTFTQWRERNPDFDLMGCPHCRGYDIECEICNNTRTTAWREYQIQLEDDKKRLERFKKEQS